MEDPQWGASDQSVSAIDAGLPPATPSPFAAPTQTRAAATLKKVLIVEDIAPIQQVLRELIEKSGRFKVCAISDSQAEAIEYFTRLEPDAVVLDLHLRDGSGLGFLRHIRAGAQPPLRAFVVVITTHASESIREACMALGADAFLDKNHELLGMDYVLHAHL